MKKLFAISVLSLLLLSMAGCGNNADYGLEDDYPDKMYRDSKENETLFIFKFDSAVYEMENFQSIDYSGDTELVEGNFYKLVADVEYLSGGVSGFCNYPQIEEIHSCEVVSPDELSLPTYEQNQFGLINIRDYTDADYFFSGITGGFGVYKDGNWIYKYSGRHKNDDGSYSFFNGEITQEEIEKGVESGTVCCADYFYLPAIGN